MKLISNSSIAVSIKASNGYIKSNNVHHKLEWTHLKSEQLKILLD